MAAQELRTSGNHECSDEFEIYSFQRWESFPPGRPWRVVVGHNIRYKARPDEGSNWIWKLGSGDCENNDNFWNLMSSDGNGLEDKGSNAIIEESSMPENNSAFGSAYGNLFVSNDLDETCTNKNAETAVAEVFFEKDLTNNPGGTDPNWFYYWSQIPIVQDLLTIPGVSLYNTQQCTFNLEATPLTLNIIYDGANYPYNEGDNSTYGLNGFDAKRGTDTRNIGNGLCDQEEFQVVTVGYEPEESFIVIGEGCGFASRRELEDGGPGYSPNIYGIHVFYSTVVHETEHARIDCDVWQFTHPSDPTVKAGVSSLWDLDNDGYKDLWETKSEDGMMFGFDYDMLNPVPDDMYNPAYTLQCFYEKTCSAGTIYEETRCRNKEFLLNESLINEFDWSFDPTHEIQGKQWNTKD